jgi:Cytochrome C oxidase, cbb3-type, subunit III
MMTQEVRSHAERGNEANEATSFPRSAWERLGSCGKRTVFLTLVAGGFLAVTACQQKMAQQPYFRPLEETEFFDDHRASRPLEPGTVARNKRREDDPLVTGLTAAGRKAATKKIEGADVTALAGAPSSVENFVDVFPFKITDEDLQRGMERFTIYCTPCHSPAGDGKGKVVERGYLKPTNYHYEPPDRGEDPSKSTKGLSRGFGRFDKAVVMSPTDPRRSEKVPVAPVGYYFEVISKGFGGMPEHASQIPDPADRWRIVAYIRVLQLSHASKLKDLPESIRGAAEQAADKKANEEPGGHP